MEKDIRVGTIFGIEIHLDYSWLIIVGLIAWSFISVVLPSTYPSLSTSEVIIVGLISTMLFFASLLTHEMAHSLYARKHDIKVKRITLFIFGGAAEIESEPKTPRVEITMAILGPITSFILAFFFALVASFGTQISNPAIEAAGGLLSSINFILAIFNLAPAFPLDGGRVLRGIIWKSTGNESKATRIAAKSGRAFSYILISIGVLEIFTTGNLGGLWLILIGTFLNAGASATLLQNEAKSILGNSSISQLMNEDYVCVPPNTTIKDFFHNYVLELKEKVFIVTRDNQPEGIIDINNIKDAKESEFVEGYMTKLEHTLHPDEKVSDCLEKILTNELTPVVEKESIVGVVSRKDIQTFVVGKRTLGNMKH